MGGKASLPSSVMVWFCCVGSLGPSVTLVSSSCGPWWWAALSRTKVFYSPKFHLSPKKHGPFLLTLFAWSNYRLVCSVTDVNAYRVLWLEVWLVCPSLPPARPQSSNLPSSLILINSAQLHLTKTELSISIVKLPIISIRHGLLRSCAHSLFMHSIKTGSLLQT